MNASIVARPSTLLTKSMPKSTYQNKRVCITISWWWLRGKGSSAREREHRFLLNRKDVLTRPRVRIMGDTHLRVGPSLPFPSIDHLNGCAHLHSTAFPAIVLTFG